MVIYDCESWTLNAESEKRIDAFEINCCQKILQIQYTAYRTNASIKEEVVNSSGNHESFLSMIKKRKMQWFGHVTRNQSYLNLANSIMHGRVPRKRGRGRPRKTWLCNINEWTNLSVSEASRKAMDRKLWKNIIANMRVHLRPIGYEH